MTASDRRCGVLVPAGNVVHEREFAALRPPGVSFRFAPFRYPDMSASTACNDLVTALSTPLAELAAWQPEIVLLGCTTASMICTSPALYRRLEELAGCPMISAAEGVRSALTALEITSLAVATPYGPDANSIIRHYLEQNCCPVSTIAGQGFDRAPAAWKDGVQNFTAQHMLAFALSLETTEANGLYMPCTAFSSLAAIARFEEATGKPAISSVQAGYWACMTRLGVDGRRVGEGRLLGEWVF